MNREVWVECNQYAEGSYMVVRETGTGASMTHLRQITIHEYRWIPVSERMPEKPGHYHVVRLDREDWCYCEINEEFNCKPHTRFTSKGVTHWLEAPPLPLPLGEDGFEKWVSSFKIAAITSLEDCMKSAWNAAKESTLADSQAQT